MSGRVYLDSDPDGQWNVVHPAVQARASPAQTSAQRGAHPSASSPTQSRAAQPPQTSRAGHAAQPSASSTTSALVHSRPSASSSAQDVVDRQPVHSSSAQSPPRTQPTAAEAYESDLTYSETDESEADESEADESEAVESVAAEPDAVEADVVEAGPANVDAAPRPGTVAQETALVRMHLMFRHWVEAGCLSCRGLGIACEQPPVHTKQEKCKHCSLEFKPCTLRWILYMPRVIELVQKLRHVDLSTITPEFLAAELEVFQDVKELGGFMDRCKDYGPLAHRAPAEHPVERPSSERNDHTPTPKRMTSDRNAQTHTPPPSSEPQRGASARRKRTFDTMLNDLPTPSDDDMREQGGVGVEVLQQHQAELAFFGPTITSEQLLGVCARTLSRIAEEMNR
ncbi:uncharacterized protein PSANT_02931 [Moesziomyces antarcticus]|uniref:Uncharacterized protein n=1 Tax=Pseudozyma antarctica TaxID=84753 RepID=A0A5C3FN84_PSEA2|nr:uncharacterized protein PSANT_02931 [Moesziomyces antarcticus]